MRTKPMVVDPKTAAMAAEVLQSIYNPDLGPEPSFESWRETIGAELAALRSAPSPDSELEPGTVGAPRGEIAAFLAAAGSNGCERCPLHADDLYADRYLSRGQRTPHVYPQWSATNEHMVRVTLQGWQQPAPDFAAPVHVWNRWLQQHYDCFHDRPGIHPGRLKPGRVFIRSRGRITVTPGAHHVRPLLDILLPLVYNAPSPWRRSVLLEYLAVRLHPFADGNGRLSRIVSNEVCPAVRIPFPLLMDDYIDGLVALQDRCDAGPWLNTLAIWQQRSHTLQKYTGNVEPICDIPEIIYDWGMREWITVCPWRPGNQPIISKHIKRRHG